MSLLIDNFKIIVSALLPTRVGAGRSARKSNAVGIQKIREFVLELAVRGLLFSQDLSDEPASDLLKRIKTKKEQIAPSGKTKKRIFIPIGDDEKQFQTPKGWEWARLGDIGKIFNGNSINESVKRQKYTNVINGYPYIATKDVGYGREELDYENGVKIPFENGKFRIAKKNSVLICSEGGSAGRKIGLTKQDICFGNKLIANEILPGLVPEYVFYVYQSETFYKCFEKKTTGIIGGVSINEFVNIPISIPPYKEQKRIVAKIDQLMSLCDELEAKQEQQNYILRQLNDAALNSLLSATSTEEFEKHWQRVVDNFDTLYDELENLNSLRQAILQMAVRGELTGYWRKRHPELLTGANHASTIIENQKDKYDSDHSGLPTGWIRCKLHEIAKVVRGGSPRPAGDLQFYDGKIPFLKVADLTATDDIYLNSHTFTIKEAGLKKTRFVEANTLMLTNSGATLGIPKICTFPTTFNDGIAAFLDLPKKLNQVFLYYFLKSRSKWYLEEASRGQGQPNLNIEIIGETVLDLPPFEEQKVIVEQINRFITLCDELEKKLTAKSSQLEKLTLSLLRI